MIERLAGFEHAIAAARATDTPRLRIEIQAGCDRCSRPVRDGECRRQASGSVVRAEERVGESSGLGKALAALQHARDLDQAGDGPACQRALVEAWRALNP